MKNKVYEKVLDFKKRYPLTISWRLWAHSKLANKLINEDEEVLYAFAAQKDPSSFNIFSTFVVVLTDKRIVLAQKRAIGYFYYSITPDMFNDLTLQVGLIWGKVIIDTVREQVYLSNLSKGAIQEIETVLSKYMIQKKRQLEMSEDNESESIRQMEKDIVDISKNGEK